VSAGPSPRFDHLLSITDHRGTFEHAYLAEPRRSHGYCTDDMARVLLVSSREPAPTFEVRQLAIKSLAFLDHARSASGAFRNRLNEHGRWTDHPTTEDCWGRSIWALGTAAAQVERAELSSRAAQQLEEAIQQRSVWLRAMCFASLGAAELLGVVPGHVGARALLVDVADRLDRLGSCADWLWPESRLSYSNAVLPEAMIATGAALERPQLLRQGLELLSWLLEHETVNGHLSVAPAGGAGPRDRYPRFDQQPIEVAALADACTRAARYDGDRCWPDGVADAAAWFLGANDAQVVMWNPETGAGFDGLIPGGTNLNCGAESTLALLSTLQQARRFVSAEG
jgi:hypothetical protein